jgi:anti-sigma-K factor RskA
MSDVHMLSGAYALDAIDDDEEREAFERHLEECEACRIEVRSLREVAAALGDAVAVAPPPELRHRVLDRIAATPQLPPVAAVRTHRAAGRPDERRAGWRVAVAAAAVVLVGGGAVGAGVELVQARRADEQARRVLSLAADPAARRVSGAVAGGGTATVIVAGSQAALVADGVRVLPEDRVYQLWLVRPGEIVSAGLGPEGTGAGGRWSRLITGVRAGDQVAISVEPAGGSAQPTTKPLVAVQA